MKLNLKLKPVKNKSQLNINLNSSRRNFSKKLIPQKSSRENSKTLTYSNSKVNIKNNLINQSDSSFINESKNKNFNIDETNYNKDLFVIPKKFNKKHHYMTNIEKAVETYNEIKKEINNKLFSKKVLNNIKAIQLRNYSLVTLLEKLNKVLDAIVERGNMNKNKIKLNSVSQSQEINKNRSKNKENRIKDKKKLETQINHKLLANYIQQFNLLSSKYDKLTNGNYVVNLKLNISSSVEDITKLEKENKELKRTQSRNELILKHLKASKDELNYKKKLEEYDKLSNENDSLNKNVKQKETELNINQKLIKKLEDNKNKLTIIAKNDYNIQNPEEAIEQKRDEKEIEKMKLYIKRKELENIVFKKNNEIKKYVIMEKDNQKMMKMLEETLSMKNLDLKIRREEIYKLNEMLEKVDIENNSLVFKTELKEIKPKKKLNKNIKEVIKENEKETTENNNINSNSINNSEKKLDKSNEINENYKQKSLIQSQPQINIGELNNRYSIKREQDSSQNDLQVAKTYNKKMILQQLDDQKKREQDNFSKIRLNKKNLKPNFSFSLNNSSKKENQEKNVNLSVALISNRNKDKDLEVKNETEEIKEDTNNTNAFEDKLRPEEEPQRINTNLSQNISLDKEKKEKNEEIINEDNENIDENFNENINEKEELDSQNKKNKIENSDEKSRQNALNTLPFYDMEEEEKEIKADNNNGNDNKINNEEESKTEKEIKKEEEKVEENLENKEEKNEEEKEEKKEEEKKEEKKEEDNYIEDLDNYFEDDKNKENLENKENKEDKDKEKENKDMAKNEQDNENYIEEENFYLDDK